MTPRLAYPRRLHLFFFRHSPNRPKPFFPPPLYLPRGHLLLKYAFLPPSPDTRVLSSIEPPYSLPKFLRSLFPPPPSLRGREQLTQSLPASFVRPPIVDGPSATFLRYLPNGSTRSPYVPLLAIRSSMVSHPPHSTRSTPHFPPILNRLTSSLPPSKLPPPIVGSRIAAFRQGTFFSTSQPPRPPLSVCLLPSPSLLPLKTGAPFLFSTPLFFLPKLSRLLSLFESGLFRQSCFDGRSLHFLIQITSPSLRPPGDRLFSCPLAVSHKHSPTNPTLSRPFAIANPLPPVTHLFFTDISPTPPPSTPHCYLPCRVHFKLGPIFPIPGHLLG